MAAPLPIIVNMNTIIGSVDIELANARRLLMFFDLSSPRNIQANNGKLAEIQVIFGNLEQYLRNLQGISNILSQMFLINDDIGAFIIICNNKILEIHIITQKIKDVVADSTPKRLAERIKQIENTSGPPQGGKRKTRSKKGQRKVRHTRITNVQRSKGRYST
jgi:glutamyl-tRNA reductase